MFFTAAYGLDETLHRFSANVNNSSLCDFMKDKYLDDCTATMNQKREQGRRDVTRLEKQLANQSEKNINFNSEFTF